MNKPPIALQRPEVGTVIWSCHPRFILCPDDHLYTFRESGMHRDHRLISGHDFFRCDHCKPSSHFFVVFSTTPDLNATCYLISEECWREWYNAPDQALLPTREMLNLIRDPAGRSYNPTYTPR